MANQTEPARATLRYSGEAVDAGTMDVRDFGPALLSFADLVQRAAAVTYGDEARVRVRIRSDIRKGSVVAHLDLYLEGAQQLAAFATAQYGVDFATLLQLVGIHKGTGVNLIGFLKWLNGRKEQQVITQENGSVAVQVQGDNNTVLIVPPEVYDLARDEALRRAAYGVARPLEQEGVSTLEFKEGRRVAEKISADDTSALQASVRSKQPTETTDIEDRIESEEMLTVDLLQGVFSEDESFRFYDGDSKFWARISDQNWWAAIHHRTDGYYEGDRMRVRLVVRQGVDAKGRLMKEREIVEVLWHEHKPKQTDLFAPDRDK